MLVSSLPVSVIKISCRDVNKELFAESGSVLLLVVRNSQLFGKDDPLGMCVISCKTIPSGDERKVEHRPLFQFPLSNSKSFKELQDRKQGEAAKFCKQMKTLIIPAKYIPRL